MTVIILIVRDDDIRLLARVLEGGAPVGGKKRIEMGEYRKGMETRMGCCK